MRKKNQTNTHARTQTVYSQKKKEKNRDYLHFKLRYKQDAESLIYLNSKVII